MKKIIFIFAALLMAASLCSCEDKEEQKDVNFSSSVIVGKWALAEVGYAFSNYTVNAERDTYVFEDNGVVVVKRNNNDTHYFLEPGKRQYEYEQEKNQVRIEGRTYYCHFPVKGKMEIGYSAPDDNGTVIYRFESVK